MRPEHDLVRRVAPGAGRHRTQDGDAFEFGFGEAGQAADGPAYHVTKQSGIESSGNCAGNYQHNDPLPFNGSDSGSQYHSLGAGGGRKYRYRTEADRPASEIFVGKRDGRLGRADHHTPREREDLHRGSIRQRKTYSEPKQQGADGIDDR